MVAAPRPAPARAATGPYDRWSGRGATAVGPRVGQLICCSTALARWCASGWLGARTSVVVVWSTETAVADTDAARAVPLDCGEARKMRRAFASSRDLTGTQHDVPRWATANATRRSGGLWVHGAGAGRSGRATWEGRIPAESIRRAGRKPVPDWESASRASTPGRCLPPGAVYLTQAERHVGRWSA